MRKPGRPHQQTPPDEEKRSRTVSITNKQRTYLLNKFGSLTKAILTLIK